MGADLEPLLMGAYARISTANHRGQEVPTSAHRTGHMVSPSDSIHAIQSGHGLVNDVSLPSAAGVAMMVATI